MMNEKQKKIASHHFFLYTHPNSTGLRPWRPSGGMADAGDLKSPARQGRVGSSPTLAKFFELQNNYLAKKFSKNRCLIPMGCKNC